jgi:stage II sporulation protein AA (anti-sigma F factor antagonist)
MWHREMASRLQVTRHDDVLVIRFLDQKLAGELPEQLGDELYSVAAEADCTKILLNFSGVEFLASDMLGKVVGLNKRMKGKGGRLALCDVCHEIHQVITITKLDTILIVKGTEAEGLMELA